MERLLLAGIYYFGDTRKALATIALMLADPDCLGKLEEVLQDPELKCLVIEMIDIMNQCFDSTLDKATLKKVYGYSRKLRPHIKFFLNKYRNMRLSYGEDADTYVKQCPFYYTPEEGHFYYTADKERVSPIDNSGFLSEVCVWCYPVEGEIVDEWYKSVSPLQRFGQAFWDGVSDYKVGKLNIPFHPVLTFKLEYVDRSKKVYTWIGFDWGSDGVGILRAPFSYAGNSESYIQELLQTNSNKAKLIKRFSNLKSRSGKQITLYDFLHYGITFRPSVKWHLQHFDDVIEACSNALTQNCWGFAGGALSLFNGWVTQEEVAEKFGFSTCRLG
jgi:hypothetical protein